MYKRQSKDDIQLAIAIGRFLKKPFEIMNAKARRAELSRMIDGRRTNEYSSSASKAEFPYVHTQLAIATRLRRKTIIKNPDIKKQKEVFNNKKKNSKALSSSKQIKLQGNTYVRKKQEKRRNFRAKNNEQLYTNSASKQYVHCLLYTSPSPRD